MWGRALCGAAPAAPGADVTRGQLRGCSGAAPQRWRRGSRCGTCAGRCGPCWRGCEVRAGAGAGRGSGRAGPAPRGLSCVCAIAEGEPGEGREPFELPRFWDALGTVGERPGRAGTRWGPGPGTRGAAPQQGCCPRRVCSCGACPPLTESRNGQGLKREIFKIIKSSR